MARLLFIDTSTALAMVAVTDQSVIRSQLWHETPMEQAAMLSSLIEQATAEAGWRVSDLDALCICAGPGSYTGLRVGLSTAKGLAYALNKPLLLFNRLDLLAAANTKPQPVAVVLKARKGEYFFAVYAADKKVIVAPCHLFEAHLQELLPENSTVVTDDQDLQSPNQIQYISSQEAISLISWLQLAAIRYAQQAFDDLAYCEPFYLKAAYTTTPKK